MINWFKTHWLALAQASVWLTSLVLLFVVEPPRRALGSDSTQYVHLAQFAMAVLIGLTLILLKRHHRAHAIVWRAAAGFLVAGIVSFFVYTNKTDQWTCYFDGRGPMIIGETYQRGASTYLKANPELTCQTLIQNYAGQTDDIWKRDELAKRQSILVGLFLFCILTFSMSAILVLEGLRRSPSDWE